MKENILFQTQEIEIAKFRKYTESQENKDIESQLKSENETHVMFGVLDKPVLLKIMNCCLIIIHTELWILQITQLHEDVS